MGRSTGSYGRAFPQPAGHHFEVQVTSLPRYDQQLSAFHRAFRRELDAIVSALPVRGDMRVLDLACGDGFYTRRLAERLGPGGWITGADISLEYLAEAGEAAARESRRAKIDFVAASFDQLPFP